MPDQTNRSGLTGPAVILAMLAALGIGPKLVNPPSQAAPVQPVGLSTAPESPKHTATSYEHGAANLLDEFFDTDQDQIPEGKPWSADDHPSVDPKSACPLGNCEPIQTKWRTGDPRRNYRVDFLIATLPEPASPPLRYEFDTQLDAIELAAGRARFYLATFDLPWLDQSKDHSGEFRLGRAIDIASGDSDDQGDLKPLLKLKPNTHDETRSDRDAGVMLFRGKDKLLVVFIVGDTPTRGVNKTALRDALDQVAWLAGWKDPSDPDDMVPEYLTDVTRDFSRSAIVKLVGPAFSGSAISVRNTLDEWSYSIPPEKTPHIRIISGAATAVTDEFNPTAWQQTLTDLPQLLGDVVSMCDATTAYCDVSSVYCGLSSAYCQASSILYSPPTVDFATARVPDRILMRSVAQFLSRVPIKVSASVPKQSEPDALEIKIALLGDTTSYGDPAASDGDPAASAASGNFLKMTFPLHISDLRTAFGKIEQPKTSPGPDIGFHDIPLPDESAQKRDDVVPPFSARAAMYDDLVLARLLTTIQREQIRYVGITATDVEDLIFLVQRIRIYCPDTVVFTTAADLRFLHSDVNQDLDGMLVFSTYPLFNENQDWTYPFRGEHRRRQFTNEDGEGVFNATLAQLGRSERMGDYGVPFGGEEVEPALWISVVGHNELWPVAYQALWLDKCDHVLWASRDTTPQSDRSSASEPCSHPKLKAGPADPHPEIEPYPRVFLIVSFVLSCVFAIPAWLLSGLRIPAWIWPYLATWFPTRLRLDVVSTGKLWWFALLTGDAADKRLWHERRLYLASFVLMMLAVYWIFAVYLFAPVLSSMISGLPLPAGFFTYLCLGVAILTLGILSVAAFRTGWVRSFEQYWEAKDLPSGALILLAGSLLALVFGIVFWVSKALHDLHNPAVLFFAFIRAANLNSGVSPLMPLLLFGVAGFSIIACLLSGLILREDCQLKSSFLGFEGDESFGPVSSFAGVDDQEKRVIDLLECPPHRLPGFLVLLLLLALLAAYLGFVKVWPTPSIDGGGFDLCFLVGGIGIYLFLSILLLRFVLVWIALRRLLRRLFFHPTRGGYPLLQTQGLPRVDNKVRLFEPRPSLTAVEACLENARNILKLANSWQLWSASAAAASPTRIILETNIRQAETKLKSALDADKGLDWKSIVEQRISLQDAMVILSKQIVTLFEPAWRLISPVSPIAFKGETVDKNLLDQANLFVAARVVDFLRQVFPQLLNLVGFAMVGVVAMVLAVSVYPFPAHDTLLWMSWIVLLSAVAVSISVFVGINRSRVISLLYGTTPGRFNWDSAFTVHLLWLGVIPILTLLGAQYPHALGGIFSWVGGIFGSAGGK